MRGRSGIWKTLNRGKSDTRKISQHEVRGKSDTIEVPQCAAPSDTRKIPREYSAPGKPDTQRHQIPIPRTHAERDNCDTSATSPLPLLPTPTYPPPWLRPSVFPGGRSLRATPSPGVGAQYLLFINTFVRALMAAGDKTPFVCFYLHYLRGYFQSSAVPPFEFTCITC